MSRRTIQVPRRLDLPSSIDFCRELLATDPLDEVVFDFKWMQHVEPFSMAYVSCQIKRLVSRRSEGVTYSAVNFEKHTYAAHIGFFQAFGLDHGNHPGKASGSSTYIPITIIEVEEIRKAAAESHREVGDIVEARVSELARMLVRRDEGDLFDTLTYSLREVMRNVVEHSQSDIIEFCAQYWPTRNIVEVVVLDLGVGVRASLSNNPFLEINSDRDALQWSLMPGVSGKMFKGVRRRANDVWQNSGFGLYMTSRIARSGGSFFLGSGNSGILLERGGKTDFDLDFDGTVLRMVINTTLLSGLGERLGRFRQEGYKTAEEFKWIGKIESSVASMMLSKDFEQ